MFTLDCAKGLMSRIKLSFGDHLCKGMKAYRDPAGGARLFRPDMNMARFNTSCERLFLPAFDGEQLIECIKELIKVARLANRYLNVFKRPRSWKSRSRKIRDPGVSRPERLCLVLTARTTLANRSRPTGSRKARAIRCTSGRLRSLPSPSSGSPRPRTQRFL